MSKSATTGTKPQSSHVKHVCILARKRLSRNTRVSQQAKALSEAGYDVTIIAISEEGLPSYEEQQYWRIHRINLVTLNDVLFPLRSGSKLVRSFLPRKSMGGGRRSAEHAHPVSGDDGQVASSQMAVSTSPLGVAKSPSRFRLLKIALYGRVVNTAARTLAPLRQVDFLLRSLWILRKQPCDICHCHDSYPLLAAYLVSKLRRAKFVYDGVEYSPDRNTLSKGPLNRIWYKVEAHMIRRADAVITVGGSIASLLAATYGIDPPTPIMNCRPYQEVVPAGFLQSRLACGDRRIALYSGSVTTNRGLEELVLAARGLQNTVIVIMGHITTSGFDTALRSLIRQAGVEDRVFLMEPVAPEEVVAVASSAHLGIIPVRLSCLNHMHALPNKLFEYIMARLPIAAAAGIHEVGRIIESEEIGLVFDEQDPDSISDTIGAILSDDSLYQRMRANLDRCARTYCWEREAEKFLRVYASLDT